MTAALQFTIDGLAPDALRAYAVDGTEALSSLYSFDIDCLGPNGRAMDPLALVGQRATLRITVEGAQPRSVHGIIDTVEIEPPSIFGDARYRFRLVPWLARLRLSRSNQIHGTANAVSVADVIEAELSGALRPTARVSDTDLRRFEHELRLRDRAAYPKRDHVSQYEETDFAFISRLAEHAGIFYFFENNGDRESVVFADDNLFATPLEGGTGLQWKPWSSGGREAAPDTIQALRQRCTPVPQKLWLQDHNYRLPHVPLLVEAEVDSRGRGNWVEYGAHHRTPEEGSALARIRAEELRCHQSRWHGNSTVARLAPGRVIRLGGHPYASWNQDYLVVRVRHEVWVPMPGVPESDWVGYRNSFEMIDRDVPFRPARVTPVPRMDGLLNGRIDGAGDGSKAEIDDQGRYRVKVPFDLGGSPDGKASQWIRMSSPFGGDGDGMHFPLFPDTEVVIGCVNGDPDRPVILGAVPNPRNKAVVTSDNSLQNRLVTRSGMGFEMSNDGGDGGEGSGSGGSDGVNAYGASPPPSQLGDFAVPNALGGQAQPMILTKAGNAEALSTPDAFSSSVESGASSNYARMFVQDYVRTFTGRWPLMRATTSLGGITQELRLGAVPGATGLTAEPEKLTKPGSLGYLSPTSGTEDSPSAEGKPRTDKLFDSASGIYSYTTGKHFIRSESHLGVRAGGDIIIAAGVGQTGNNKGGVGKDLDLSAIGDIRLWAGGKVKQYANGDSENYYHGQRYTTVKGTNKTTVYGDSGTTTHGSSASKTFGDALSEIHGFQKSYIYGYSLATLYGLRTTFNFGGTFTLTTGLNMNLNLSASLVINISLRCNINIFNVTNVNLFGSMSVTNGFSGGAFTGDRLTTVAGMDIKTVAGLDAKVVGFSLDIKHVDFSKEEFAAEKKALSAKLTDLAAGQGGMDAQMKAMKLFM